MSKTLEGIAYISKLTANLKLLELETMVEAAVIKNARLNITGYLYYAKGTFFQYIEGEASTTKDLMDTIEADERHEVLQVKHDNNLTVRRFPAWNMLSLIQQQQKEILLETVIIDYMSNNARYPSIYEESDYQRGIWRMVDNLARIRSKFNST